MKQKPSNVDGEDGDDNDFETKKVKLSSKGKRKQETPGIVSF